MKAVADAIDASLIPNGLMNQVLPWGVHKPHILKLRGGGSDEPSQDDRRSKRGSRKKSKRRNKEQLDHEKDQRHRRSKQSSSDSGDTDSNKQAVNPVVDEILQEEDYYRLLGLTSKQSTTAAIKKAYRRRAVQTHPDKTGGDRRAFDKVAKAYEVLADPEKKSIYDRFGKKGVDQNNHMGASGAEDLFRSFFSGGPAGPPSRNRTAKYKLEVTLEDMYEGLERNVHVAPAQNPFQRRSMDSRKVSVSVPRGALSGQRIVVPGAMDFDANATPGDVVFIVEQQPHPIYTRKGHDLAIRLEIRWQEALCGVKREVPHLNGKPLRIRSGGGHILTTGEVHVLQGHGMPKDPQATEFGDLYIQYDVVTPSVSHAGSLSDEEKKQFASLLDKLEGRTAKSETDSEDEKTTWHVLKEGRLSDFGVASGKPEVGEFSDDYYQQSNTRQFFYSSHSGSNPFFGTRQGPMYQDDENVQCQQM